MRKFKRFPARFLAFRPLLMLAGALMLLAALAPRANASLIAYYNFEGTPTSPYPVNTESHAPAFFSSGNNLIISYNTQSFDHRQPWLTSKSLSRRPRAKPHCARSQQERREQSGHLDIPLFSSQGFFQDMTLSSPSTPRGTVSHRQAAVQHQWRSDLDNFPHGGNSDRWHDHSKRCRPYLG